MLGNKRKRDGGNFLVFLENDKTQIQWPQALYG